MSNPLQTKSRRLATVATALAVGALIWAASMRPEPVPPAQASETRQWRTAAPGIVEARIADVRLSAAIQARIVNIAVKPGDHVAEGDVLFQLDDQEEAARVQVAQANVALRQFERENVSSSEDSIERRQAEEAVA